MYMQIWMHKVLCAEVNQSSSCIVRKSSRVDNAG